MVAVSARQGRFRNHFRSTNNAAGAVRREALLVFEDHPLGAATKVVEDIDADAFTEHWLSAIEAARH